MKLKTHRTTIPAEHGWYRCTPICVGGEVVDIYQTPVIAWAITVEEFEGDECMLHARAVVAGEPVSTLDPEYLRDPCGRYTHPECPWDKTREDMIESMQQELSSRGKGKIS